MNRLACSSSTSQMSPGLQFQLGPEKDDFIFTFMRFPYARIGGNQAVRFLVAALLGCPLRLDASVLQWHRCQPGHRQPC